MRAKKIKKEGFADPGNSPGVMAFKEASALALKFMIAKPKREVKTAISCDDMLFWGEGIERWRAGLL